MALKTPAAVPPYDPSRADMRLPQAAFKFRADNGLPGKMRLTFSLREGKVGRRPLPHGRCFDRNYESGTSSAKSLRVPSHYAT